jgi:hypothetical protein
MGEGSVISLHVHTVAGSSSASSTLEHGNLRW